MKKFLVVLSVVAMASFLLVGCFQTANIAPVITTTSLPGGTVGTAYTATVNATDADGDTLTFSLSGMPTDMIIGPATGVISGWIPAAVGTVNVTVTVTDGTDPVSSAFTITVAAVPVPPPVDLTVVSIAVDDEYKEGAYTYVKGGEREITITFSRAIVNPGIDEPLPTAKVGGVTVPLNSADKKIWKGTGDFTGPCKDVLIEVGGVCDDVCAAITVTVDSVAPVISLEAEVEECDCDEGYQLVITSTGPYPECGEQTDCCGLDDCSGLKSVNVEIYTVDNEVTFPWDLCCDLEDCAELIGSDDSCPVEAKTECIPAVYTQSDEWVDFFDGIYYVKAVLEDNAGNVNEYYGEVTAIDKDTVSFRELIVDPVTCAWCYAEALADVDNIIGDCEQPPVLCYEVPLEPCPEITVVPAEPVVGQPATVTIDYTLAVKPVGTVSAYVGPAFKTLPLGVPEGSSALPLEEIDDYIYEANVVFGEAGDRIIYVVDACEDCPPCTKNITVLPAEVCPEVEFLEYTWWEEVDGEDGFGEYDIPGYGFTNVDFTVTFANRIEKELVKVYVGIPGLGPIFMPIPMPPTALQVAMTTTDEVTYNGTIPIGDVREVVVGVINHMTGLQPGDPGWVDPDQPWESLVALHPDLLYLLHTLGCIPLRIYVLAGDPCCIEVCEYPFILDPVGPFVNLEVTFDTCEKTYCFEEGCTPVPYPGHELKISTETPGLCTLEDCCDDTCCGLVEWEAYIVPCYYIGVDPPDSTVMPQGPFDDCCDFDEALIPFACAYWLDWHEWYYWSDECPVEFGPGCVFDWADPFGYHPEIDDMALSDIWDSVWYLYVKMTDCAGNTTEYKARITFTAVPGPEQGDWTITMDPIVPLCDDALDFVFGADFCVGPHF